jgi:anti-sigma factor RsiW
MTDVTGFDATHPFEALQDLFDNRLPPSEIEPVRKHLASCATCQRAWQDLDTSRAATTLLRLERELPDGLLADVVTALDAPGSLGGPAAAVSARPWIGGRRAWLRAAAVAVAAVGVGVWRFRREDPAIPALVARDLDRVTTGALALDVRTDQAAVLEAHFVRSGLAGIRVLDLAMMGYVLEGGSRHDLGGRPSALYVYRDRSRRPLVCQMYAGALADLPATDDVRDNGPFRFHVYLEGGATAVFWQEGRIVCALASIMPRDEVVALAFAKAMLPG